MIKDIVEEFWSVNQIKSALRSVSPDSIRKLQGDFSDLLNVGDSRNLIATGSAREALKLALATAPHKDSRAVWVPAFICRSVIDSITESGFRPVLYDFDSDEGKFNFEEIALKLDHDVVAIVVPHLFGVPVDFRPLTNVCDYNDILIIEDCAHCILGLITDERVGAIGHAAIYSFNYDKPIGLIGGGMLSLRKDLPLPDHKERGNYYFSIARDAAFYVITWGLLKIRRSALQKSTPTVVKKIINGAFRKVYRKPRDDFGILNAEIARYCIQKYKRISKIRNRNANYILESCNRRAWFVSDSVVPDYLKVKLYHHGGGITSPVGVEGVRVENINWPRLHDMVSASDYPVSTSASKHWVDIPVHQNLNENELFKIVRTLRLLNE